MNHLKNTLRKTPNTPPLLNKIVPCIKEVFRNIQVSKVCNISIKYSHNIKLTKFEYFYTRHLTILLHFEKNGAS